MRQLLAQPFTLKDLITEDRLVNDRLSLKQIILEMEDTVLATVVTEFVAFVGNQVSDLDEAFANTHLAEDKSLFKANEPIWHQSDRQEGRIPPKLRHLDTDAT
ncbi:MAG: hypothetical protein H6668_00390 [Ardenticatenaceae bacterium]|nr:hypothetical protein [Ardenticatenaceae bacterium]